MSIDKIKQLIGKPEGLNLEYKLVLPPPETIARILAAFANTDGGVLIIGVRDGLVIVGLAENTPVATIIESSIARLHPRPEVKHYPLELELDSETKKLYIVEVAKSSDIIYTRDKIFLRQGGQIIAKTPDFKLDLAKSPIPDCIVQLLERILQVGQSSTGSKVKFLKHYQNLFLTTKLLTDISNNLLFSKQPNLYSDIEQGRTYLRLVFSSLLDTFENYLVDLLLEIHLARPETLRSESKVTIEDVLNCQDMAEFIHFAAEERVKSLSKGNEDSFMKAFKFTQLDLFIESELEKVRNYFQVRHLYTHKNGVIDKQFISKTKLRNLNLADEYKISLTDLCETASFFIDIVTRLDSSIITKYGLGTFDVEE
jgi:hypothetical protein